MISNHLDKDNLHHAYLIEGDRGTVLPELLSFVESLGIKKAGNPDFYQIDHDTLKSEDAHNLRSFELEKSLTGGKKIFIISANNILLPAQNSLLKIFEEPKTDTHFFLIMPDANILLKTLFSRFFYIRVKSIPEERAVSAQEFLGMSIPQRLEFFKETLLEEEDTSRSWAAEFLNSLEQTLHEQPSLKNDLNPQVFQHIFKVREFLRIPGSSVKTLLESVALAVPNL